MASSLIPYPIEPADNPVTAVPDEDDEPHRAAVAQALRAWVDAKTTPLGNVGPMRMVQHVRWITMLVDDLLTVEQRRAILFALGGGQSLAQVGEELGVSRWAIGKRWPDLVEQARPLRWLSTNQSIWQPALERLLEQEEPRVDQLAEQQREAVRRLREVIDEYRRRSWDWWVLVDTPELARSVVSHPPPPEEFEHHLAHDWVHALLADYDRTRTGEKAKPRAEVTREAIYAATKQRLGHAD
ncbi:hypothetical protein [Saccharothrix obliqua]|uniref:hypothetical protein n=1 Tax=Saccharothrix obliqua TaxID=2861747 RepID=UPI001C5FC41F|nr:hypothetical protein [Saccharothrix obliqua]MBW4722450.1 hypothetical protein [Saccharothrix obliqua]